MWHVLGYRDLVGKPEGKRLLGRTRRRWEDSSKMYLQVVQVEDRWRALVNAVMNLRVS